MNPEGGKTWSQITFGMKRRPMFITSFEKFATEFNRKIPGAFRDITDDNVRLLTDHGLVKHDCYYSKPIFLP